jgi:thiol-disulfide isomerase/thioredoxin
LIAITLLASPAPLLPGSPEGKEAPRASDPVASISFSDMAGAPHTLTEFQGKVVVLEFWAPWCIPCRRGVPFLDDLEAAHAAEGLKVVALTMETDEGSVRAFLEANPGKFLVGRDPTGRSAESLGVAAMPTTFLIDRSGRAVARYEGGTERSHEELRKGVEAILRDQPLEATTASRRSPAPKGALRPWERGLLADPIMNLDGAALEGTLSEHIHTSKEGASGNGGVAGGGCGCN